MPKKVKRLHEQFQPEHYDLSLSLDRVAMTFNGKVLVRGKKTGRPSQRITFHQKELKITAASIVKHDKKGDKTLVVSRVNNQDSFDEVRLHAEEMVYPGNYTITMEFEGRITKPMNGIYPCFFTHDGQDKKLIATQFESHHAREALPCIDEPAAKATFDLTLETSAGETTLSNTPVKKQTATKDRQTTVFETTPKMSAYLLAFVTGEMGYKESKTKDGVPVRAYATPDNVDHTKFGLDAAVKILEFFNDYFGVPYPLKKLDLVALPDFNVGAMENWGLMTFRETAMLTDLKSGSIESRQIVALVIAHEISHQWFGDLVTMQWWNDLWLNESFANLMEYVAVDAVYPEWSIWEQFVSHETASAKRREGLADVQPIKCEVNHPDEINVIFDPSIVYAKGGTVLHMLMHYIGEDHFRQGLKLYFDKHAYGNTEASDLWASLGQASGQDIAGFMNDWVERPGYPLVDVGWQPGKPTVQLSQQRFVSDASDTVTVAKPWQVPLAATNTIDPSLLAKSKAVATVTETSSEKPLILNHDGQSYFLPHYVNQNHMQHIVDGIKQGQVSTIDRLLLLDNYIMLQRGGQAKTVELLELLQGYSQETSESVWGAVSMAIGEARRLIEGDERCEEQLDKLARDLVSKLVTELGWEDRPDDDAHTLRLRGLVYAVAAGAKTESVIKAGLQRFAACQKPADLAASTRTVIYAIASRHGAAGDFQKLLEMYHATLSADEREEIAAGLTAAKEPARYQRLIEMFQSSHIRRQDFFHWYVWLLRNRYSRTATWEWLTQSWDWVEKEFGSDKNLSYFARYPGSIFSRPDELKRFETFFEPKKSIVAMGHDIQLAEAEITSRIAWRKRNETTIKAWLKKQNS